MHLAVADLVVEQSVVNSKWSVCLKNWLSQTGAQRNKQL